MTGVGQAVRESLVAFLVDIDWGSLPAYFGGLALVLTVMTLRRDRRDKHREQAARVAAWATTRQATGGPQHFIVQLRNGSDLPVTAIRLVVASEKDEVRLRTRKDRVPEGRHKHHFVYRATFPPDTTEEVGGFEKPTPLEVVSLEFVDSSGQRWLRTKDSLVAVRKDGQVRRAIRTLRQR